MIDTALNMAIGWAAVFSPFVLFGAIRQTIADYRSAPNQVRCAIVYGVLWTLVFALVYVVGKALHVWLS